MEISEIRKQLETEKVVFEQEDGEWFAYYYDEHDFIVILNTYNSVEYGYYDTSNKKHNHPEPCPVVVHIMSKSPEVAALIRAKRVELGYEKPYSEPAEDVWKIVVGEEVANTPAGKRYMCRLYCNIDWYHTFRIFIPLSDHDKINLNSWSKTYACPQPVIDAFIAKHEKSGTTNSQNDEKVQGLNREYENKTGVSFCDGSDGTLEFKIDDKVIDKKSARDNWTLADYEKAIKAHRNWNEANYNKLCKEIGSVWIESDGWWQNKNGAVTNFSFMEEALSFDHQLQQLYDKHSMLPCDSGYNQIPNARKLLDWLDAQGEEKPVGYVEGQHQVWSDELNQYVTQEQLEELQIGIGKMLEKMSKKILDLYEAKGYNTGQHITINSKLTALEQKVEEYQNGLCEDWETLCALHGCKTVSELIKKTNDRIEKLEKDMERHETALFDDMKDNDFDEADAEHCYSESVVNNIKEIIEKSSEPVGESSVGTPEMPELSEAFKKRSETIEIATTETAELSGNSGELEDSSKTEPTECEYDRLKRKIEENGGYYIPVSKLWFYYLWQNRWIVRTRFSDGKSQYYHTKDANGTEWGDSENLMTDELERLYHLERIRRGYEQPDEDDIEGLRAKAEIDDFELNGNVYWIDTAKDIKRWNKESNEVRYWENGTGWRDYVEMDDEDAELTCAIWRKYITENDTKALKDEAEHGDFELNGSVYYKLSEDSPHLECVNFKTGEYKWSTTDDWTKGINFYEWSEGGTVYESGYKMFLKYALKEDNINILRKYAETVSDFELVHKDGTKWVYWIDPSEDILKRGCVEKDLMQRYTDEDAWLRPHTWSYQTKNKTTRAVYRKYAEKETIEQKFKRLEAEWKKETAMLSSMTEIAKHPSYRAIIEMKEKALPMIIESMKEDMGHWFIALSEITGENPVLPEHRGNIKDMIQDWLDWYADKEKNTTLETRFDNTTLETRYDNTAPEKPSVTSEQVGENEWRITLNEQEKGLLQITGDTYMLSRTDDFDRDHPVWIEAERIFKEQQQRETYVKRLEKYEKVWHIIPSEKYEGTETDSWIQGDKAGKCKAYEKAYHEIYLNHLLELLDSVKNQDKMEEYLNPKKLVKYGFLRGSFNCYHPNRVSDKIKQEIAAIASHLQVSELEIIADMILLLTESEE